MEPIVWTWAWRRWPCSSLPGEMGMYSANAQIGGNGGIEKLYSRNPLSGSRQSRLS